MKGSIWSVAVVALALALVVMGGNIAFGNAAEEEFVTRDDSVDKGTTTSFQIDAYRVTDNITVENSTGHELTRGDDYAWNKNNSTIEYLLSSDQDDGESVTATIAVERHEENEKTTGGILSVTGGWIGHLLLIVGMGYLLVMVFGGGGGF